MAPSGTSSARANPNRGSRENGSPVTATSVRSRDFRNAQRHSLLVSAMRYALPLAAIAVAGTYGFLVLQKSGWGTGFPQPATPNLIQPENLTMDNPSFDGFNADGGKYRVNARTAQQDFKNTHLITLNDIDGVMNDANKLRTDLKAKRGQFNSQTNVLELQDQVDVWATGGMRARLKNATIEIKENVITSNDPVEVEMTAGTVNANSMTLRYKAKEVTFAGSVLTRLNGSKPADAADLTEKAEKSKDAKSRTARPFGASGAPIEITSNRLDVNDQTKLAVFSGAVRAVQGGATLSSPDLHVTYVGQAVVLPTPPTNPGAAKTKGAEIGNDTNFDPTAPIPRGKVKRITATGPVVMTHATGDRAMSESADLDAENEKAYLTGQVVMTQAPDRKATSDSAELDHKADTVLLTGAVLVTQGPNELRGRRLYSDRKAGRTKLSSPESEGGNGRVTARFVRGAAQAAADQVKAAAAPKSPATGLLGATFKTDPSAPIDIESNTLDINDQRKSALFNGDVKAVQGGFSLRTAEMTAFYSGEAGLGEAVKDGVAADVKGAKGSADLQKIEARRAVVVQSRDGQTATGDWADFDTKKNIVTVGGDVVLTQGPNVVRGSQLVIDMTTGQSVIETDPRAAWSARAQPSNAAGVKGTTIEVPVIGGRPSAIFYPKRINEKTKPVLPETQAAPQAAPAGGASGSGWGPATKPAPGSSSRQ